MNFFAWHYSEGLKVYLQGVVHYLAYLAHYFSLSIIPRTLFAPWKRMTIEDKSGMNLTVFFENLTFNLISRGVGAAVRILLFLTGTICLILALVLGLIGLLILLIFPPLTYLKYQERNRLPKLMIPQLVGKIKKEPKMAVNLIFSSEGGRFILNHLGDDITDFLSQLKITEDEVKTLEAESFEELIRWLVKLSPGFDEIFTKQGLSKEDLIFSAKWWDQKEKRRTDNQALFKNYGRPGLGLELLFGYTPILNKCSEDLGLKKSFSSNLFGREALVSRMERVLSTNKNVILVGQPGVGKKTVVFEFARRAASGELGKKMSYHRVLELDYQLFLSSSADLNVKKQELANVLSESSSAGNIILVIKDLHRLTNKDVEGYDFTDVITQYLEKGDLYIIAIATSVEFERFIAKDSRLIKYFEPIEVVPPSKEEAMEILMSIAEEEEKKRKILISFPVLRHILEGSDRYVTDIPFPEKAIDLLRAVISYRENRGGQITVNDADTVLSEKTGISFARLTDFEKDRLVNLEQIIHERLVNQDTAVSLISQSLRARMVGVKNDTRPVGSFLFLGPTGVGKTETAKALAKVYYGSEENILRFDMAEYVGNEGISRLIGSSLQNKPGELTTAIKNRPASLLLFDEIEKSSVEVYNLFLTLLDEGYISDAFGTRVSCRHVFVIATTNAGGEYIRQLVSQGVDVKLLQRKLIDYVQRNRIFSPEFLNRFDGIVVYEPLRREHLVKVAELLLKDFLKNLMRKNIYLSFGEDVCLKLASEGYDPAFGARTMRRIIDLNLSDSLGKAILRGEINDGDKIRLKAGLGRNEYSWEKVS